MSKSALEDFKKNWLQQYVDQYKKGSREERRAIKDNLYKNTGMTENEKNYIWGIIMRHFLNSDK